MSLQEDKWVRIMCDVAADGVWQKDGCAADLEELPVSPETRALIDGWQLMYEALSGWGEVEMPNLRAGIFSDMGRAIAKRVKAELPDWTVVYYDELAARNGGDRAKFEYEV